VPASDGFAVDRDIKTCTFTHTSGCGTSSWNDKASLSRLSDITTMVAWQIARHQWLLNKSACYHWMRAMEVSLSSRNAFDFASSFPNIKDKWFGCNQNHKMWVQTGETSVKKCRYHHCQRSQHTRVPEVDRSHFFVCIRTHSRNVLLRKPLIRNGKPAACVTI